VVLALAVAGVGTAYWYFGFGPGSLIAVPNLAGETRQVAEDRLRGLELGSDFELRDSDDVAEGLVIESDPPPSERVKAGTVVNLVVSAGIRMVTIPAEGVVGVDVGLAEAALTEARLDGPVTRELVYDTTVAEGLVLSVEPEGGQSVPHNQAIKLVVSKGPEPIEAPKLTGLTLADAQAAGAEWELTVIQDGEAYSETVAEGLIISQTPNEAEGTYRGRQVTVVVSLGMPFVEVPALRFKTWEQAVAALDAVGLKADQTGVPILGIVQRSDPEAGTSVRKGSTVTVVLV
jgi:serine/threonine-protein kinase